MGAKRPKGRFRFFAAYYFKIENTMQVSGKIVIIVNDKLGFGGRMRYGFVKVKGMENVFFNSTISVFLNTSFEDLKVDDRVRITVKETDRGPFAENLTLSKRRIIKNIPSSKVNL